MISSNQHRTLLQGHARGLFVIPACRSPEPSRSPIPSSAARPESVSFWEFFAVHLSERPVPLPLLSRHGYTSQHFGGVFGTFRFRRGLSSAPPGRGPFYVESFCWLFLSASPVEAPLPPPSARHCRRTPPGNVRPRDSLHSF